MCGLRLMIEILAFPECYKYGAAAHQARICAPGNVGCVGQSAVKDFRARPRSNTVVDEDEAKDPRTGEKDQDCNGDGRGP